MTPQGLGLLISNLVDQDDSEVVVLGDNGRDEFRNCEIGISFGGLMIYDHEKLVDHFMEHQGMSDEDAQEWINFNIAASGMVLIQ